MSRLLFVGSIASFFLSVGLARAEPATCHVELSGSVTFTAEVTDPGHPVDPFSNAPHALAGTDY